MHAVNSICTVNRIHKVFGLSPRLSSAELNSGPECGETLFGARLLRLKTHITATHRQLLICDKAVVKVLAYVRFVLTDPPGSTTRAVLDPMTVFCGAWPPAPTTPCSSSAQIAPATPTARSGPRSTSCKTPPHRCQGHLRRRGTPAARHADRPRPCRPGRLGRHARRPVPGRRRPLDCRGMVARGGSAEIGVHRTSCDLPPVWHSPRVQPCGYTGWADAAPPELASRAPASGLAAQSLSA